eukprot:scaffold296348_cov18-Tisochrysis_lutea.AAC.1
MGGDEVGFPSEFLDTAMTSALELKLLDVARIGTCDDLSTCHLSLLLAFAHNYTTVPDSAPSTKCVFSALRKVMANMRPILYPCTTSATGLDAHMEAATMETLNSIASHVAGILRMMNIAAQKGEEGKMKRVTCCPKLACSKDVAPLSSPPPPAIIFDEGLVDIAVTATGDVGFYFVSTTASYSKVREDKKAKHHIARDFCEDRLSGALLTVENEGELVNSGVAVAREFFERNSKETSLQ